MNLLPKTDVHFAEAKYWDKFFRERGLKEFEWYGEYTQLCTELGRYVKQQDSILVVGCGNSMLSSDMYDVGYRSITNIDISPVVIRQMKNKMGTQKSGMIYEQMDALNMSFEKEKFSVVIDKGTLDALMPNDTDTDRRRAKNLFSEVDRVLKLNGRYIIISLLQSHILKELLSFFMDLGWMIRILRCWDVEKRNIAERGSLTMPVFMVVCLKLKNQSSVQPIMEINVLIDGKSERKKSKEEVMASINGIQKTIFHFREFRDDIEIKFYRTAEDRPRYTIYVTDASQDQRELLRYAAFIVPHGRETEWMFGSKAGRSYLRESSGFDRLAVITFHRYQDYGTMEDVQDELRQTVLQLAPPYMSLTPDSPKIPYLTLADGVGHREIIYSGNSTYSGDLIVEDVELEDGIFRRLVFMNNQGVVQSEVKMKRGTRSFVCAAKLNTLHPYYWMVPKEDGKDDENKIVDPTHVASHHILYMSIPVSLKHFEGGTVAVVGVGGGSLCLLLRNVFPLVRMTGVEIDPLVAELAKQYFGLETDGKLEIKLEDGIEFLNEKRKFDIIMLDVDSKDRCSALCGPPRRFVESSTLEAVSESLGEEGIFVINVVSRMNSEHERLIKNVEKYFPIVCWYDLQEDVNRIVFASKSKDKSKEDWRQLIKEAASTFNNILREKKVINASIDLNHFRTGLCISD